MPSAVYGVNVKQYLTIILTSSSGKALKPFNVLGFESEPVRRGEAIVNTVNVKNLDG